MGSTRILILSILLSATAMAQNEHVLERVNQRTDRVSFFDVQRGPDHGWIISGQANPGTNISAPMYFVQSTDSAGAVIWDHGHDLMPLTYDGTEPANRDKISVLSDGSVVVVGMQDGCDVITGVSNLIKLSPSGTLEWNKEFGELSGFDPENVFDRLATNATDKIAIASSDSIILYQTNGDLLAKWRVTDSGVRCLRWQSDTTLLVAAASKIIRYKEDGVLLDSVSLPPTSFAIDIHHSSDTTWVLTDDLVHLFDQQFQFTSSIDVSILGTSLAFEEVDGAVHLSDESGLWRITPEYDLENVLGYSNDVAASSVGHGVVMTVSTDYENSRTSGLMKSYRWDGTSIEHTDDVELLVTLDSIYTHAGFQSGPEPIFVHWASLSPRIVNHSQDSLFKVMVSYSDQYVPGFCGFPGFTVIEEHLAMGHLDTVSINFPPFRVGYYGPFIGDSVLTYSVCIVAQSPNDHLDIFPSDNIWCDDLSFVLPLAIDEAGKDILSVYPNPTTGIVNLPQIDALSWELFDPTGRLIANGGTRAELNLETMRLAQQTYGLLLTVGENRRMVKLVYLKP